MFIVKIHDNVNRTTVVDVTDPKFVTKVGRHGIDCDCLGGTKAAYVPKSAKPSVGTMCIPSSANKTEANTATWSS
jgi:hypothetical protein